MWDYYTRNMSWGMYLIIFAAIILSCLYPDEVHPVLGWVVAFFAWLLSDIKEAMMDVMKDSINEIYDHLDKISRGE